MKNPLRILHVEDSPNDAKLVETMLQRQGIVCDVLRVETRADYISALEQSRFDLILGDYTMPGFDGLTALKIAQEKRPDVPFVFVSGTLGEDVAIEALKHGAVDYVLKDRLSRLVTCVRRALHEVEEQRERKRAEEALRGSEARKKAMLEGALDCIIAIDHQGKILEFNPAAERTFGYALDQVMGKPLADLIIPSRLRERHKQGLKQYIATGEGPFIGKVVEVTAMRADGTEFPAELAITSIGQKWPPMFLGHLRDITEHKLAQKERERLVSIIEGTTDLVGIADPEGRLLYLNKNGRKMLGISEDEDISGFQVSDSHPEPARKLVFEEAIPTAIREGAWSGENFLLTRDGREIPVLQVILAHRAPDGSVEFLSTIMRDITERKQAEEEIQRNLERIRALHEIDLAITSTLDLKTVLDVLLEKIDLFLPYQGATTVRLVNRESKQLEPVACRNLPEEEWKAATSKASGALARMLPNGNTPVIVRNAQTEPLSLAPDFLRKHGLVSVLRVPLIAKGETLGVLAFLSKEERNFDKEEIEFFTTLAGQAAIAIHNSKLYEEIQASRNELESTNRRLEKSLQELSSFYSALAPLAPTESVNKLMEGIIARLMIATGADAALIRLWDDAKGALTLASQRGFPDYYLKAVEAVGLGGAADWVFKSGEPIISPNIAAEARFKGKIQLKVGLRSCAMLPLKVENRVRGIVHLASRDLGFFDESQRDHLMTIARQMSIMLENREFFEHLKTSRDELEKSNRVKDEFLSVMSHELRTPLNVVVGYTGMIMDGLLGEVNDKQKEAMEKVINRTNDQLAMVNNILYATIIDTEKIKVESHPVVLGDFFKQLSSTYVTPLNKQLSFNWDCPSPLAVFHTDSAKLKQILQNLIDNALKFTAKGSVTISARVSDQPSAVSDRSMQNSTPWVEFKVADTGAGIPKEALPFIFDKFKQVDSSETRSFGGVGMGLYIVKQFTELLDGTVEVESEPGKGTTFTVTIPRKK